MNKFLFIDDAQISWMRDVERWIHPARKYEGNPIITSDRDWEGSETTLGTVRKEPEGYRMWYQSYASAPDPHGIDSFIRSLHLYAESDDGLEWSKPSLGTTEDSTGSVANNIAFVRRAFSKEINPSVMHHPHASGGHSYTMFSYGLGYDLPYDGHFVSWSDDGLQWSDASQTPVIPGYGERGCFNYDEVEQCFRGILTWEASDTHLFSTQSPNGLEWSLPRPVLTPDEVDTEWAAGESEKRTLFPAMPIARYGPLLLGFLQVLRGRHAGDGFDGEMDVQLVSSRDGETWHRVGDRCPIIERGSDDALWDSGLVWMGNSLVQDGDRVVAYYTGCRRTPGALARSKWSKSIGTASWPVDRFVGLAARGEGMVETTASVAAGQLHINADASRGLVTVALLEEDGSAIGGYSAADCKPLKKDALDHAVEWAGGDLSSLADRTVRIQLTLRDAELFSLWWCHER
tara:strand:+ start:17930 stop:19306 length:1377 start_codon:yes stop_codon:yes gene_type:complete